MSKEDLMREAEELVRRALTRLGHSGIEDNEVKAAAAKIVRAHPTSLKAREKRAA